MSWARGRSAQRLRRDQLLELGDQARVPAERQVGLDPLLQCGEPRVLEPGGGLGPERLRGELGQSGPAPERKRLREYSRGLVRVGGSEVLAALAHEQLEAVEVERALVDP